MKKLIPVSLLFTLVLSACNLSFSRTDRVKPSSSPDDAATSAVQPKTDPATATTGSQTVILFGIGMHIEPFGKTEQGYSNSKKMDYGSEKDYLFHVDKIRSIADIIEAHGGVMTVQAQSPFTTMTIESGNNILADLAEEGNEIALHFHEDAHLGKNSAGLPVKKWCTIMNEEIDLIKKASGVDQINYWSGGNLYADVFQAGECAGLSINSDWKSPKMQTTDVSLYGIHPWRPSGGTDGKDFSLISSHDPDGKIIFLPEGLFDAEDRYAMKDGQGGDEAYINYIKESLMATIAAAESGKVNVFHITVHPGEYMGNPSHPFEIIDGFLTDVIDPLVASGQVKWATFSQMAEAYQGWEINNPGTDPR